MDANFAVFFLPPLWPELRLLDCGGGPGSITLGLAAAVAPGKTVGLDWEAKRIEVAKQHGVQEGITNVRFEVANVYEYPFPMDKRERTNGNLRFHYPFLRLRTSIRPSFAWVTDDYT